MPDREIIFNSRKRLFETNIKKKKKREEKRKIRYNSLSVREKRLPDDCLSRKILVIFVGEKKRKRFEIKSRDEEERDVHARQRNGIAISTWTIGRKEHGLHDASLIKIFSIRFDPPFLFFFPHTSQHTLFLSILPLLLS